MPYQHTQICPLNSSTDILAADALFTGQGVEVALFKSISIFVDTDQDGTLYAEFSADGTNWDRSKPIKIDQGISSGSTHGLSVATRYFRTRLQNGSTAQTHLRLQVMYHRESLAFLMSSGSQQISDTNDVQLVRVVNDAIFDMSRGRYADRKSYHRFGVNDSVGTASFEDVWGNGGTYPFPTTAETLRIKSGGNAADDSDGGLALEK